MNVRKNYFIPISFTFGGFRDILHLKRDKNSYFRKSILKKKYIELINKQGVEVGVYITAINLCVVFRVFSIKYCNVDHTCLQFAKNSSDFLISVTRKWLNKKKYF